MQDVEWKPSFHLAMEMTGLLCACIPGFQRKHMNRKGKEKSVSLLISHVQLQTAEVQRLSF